LTRTRHDEHTNIIHPVLLAVLIIASATGIGWLFRSIGFPETNIVIVYLLSIIMIARFTQGYCYGIVASVVATGVFNYVFTEPYYTFSVNDPTYLITFVVMTVTALITSALTSKVKQNAAEALEKETEAKALYHLTNQLTDATDIPDIASIATRTISTILECQAACLCFGADGKPEQSFIQQVDAGKIIRRELNDREALQMGSAGLGSACAVGDEFHDWPIYGRNTTLGLLRIPNKTAVTLDEPQKRLLRSMIESMALAMDRFRSVQEQQKSHEETVQERYRSNLLRAISHDLRTPLSGIMGTAEMLTHMTDMDDPRYPLAETIRKDADWLHTLVENILSLTRLQDGKLTITKQLEAVEEVVSGAVRHVMQRAPEYEIKVDIPRELLLVPMDAKLIEQVFINMLDNATRHTPPDKEISISVQEDKEKSQAVFSVLDRGSGILAQDLPHIFQMFYTTRAKQADAVRSVGLGLSICEAIVKAHGGTISAHNRTDGPGAAFIFTLPMEVPEHVGQN